MALLSGRKRGRALSRLATTAIAVTLLGATAGTLAQAQAAPQPSAAAPVFGLFATKATGEVYTYEPNGRGGFGDRELLADTDSRNVTASVQVDHNRNGLTDGLYFRAVDGTLGYSVVPETDEEAAKPEQEPKRIGGGWNIYDRLLSPGNLGGSTESDLLARDKSGVLWIYTARQDGTLGDRVRVGAGWDQFTDIVGRGDLNGDGKADIVAKDKNGVLWFYKGTGNTSDPFAGRVKVGSGWNTYDTLFSTGDLDGDGRSDMLARDKTGVLWFYKGNGNQTDPFAGRVRIGGGWGQYNNFF
ncbi:FG-GAP-like repeat-containing protein [Streptomyces sp. UNOB3_S3]|uniref:FG-GAP-like repeat-containing protein n=1 Tax=Streptomyces sp. UNOB3_S3 TaxID=2871682 RepID=UPI001E4F35DC|nr:FG-GAP-like repeat-containing protein [Streptomyces sp. UNOB3_S3]MCC3778745.1 VCBS repeat-containing protein [Streptomyces sp. UNOB3_S3]